MGFNLGLLDLSKISELDNSIYKIGEVWRGDGNFLLLLSKYHKFSEPIFHTCQTVIYVSNLNEDCKYYYSHILTISLIQIPKKFN